MVTASRGAGDGLALSGGVGDIDEAVLESEAPSQGRPEGLHAKALGGVVSAGEEGHTRFAREVGLRLGNLAREVGVGPGGDGGLEETLRAARAPSDAPQRPPGASPSASMWPTS